MSDPTSPENTIKFPTLQQIATAVLNLVKGLFVAFSPILSGEPLLLRVVRADVRAGLVFGASVLL